MITLKEIEKRSEKPDVMARFEALKNFAVEKPTTPRAIKKNDPVAMFLDALDVQYKAFKAGETIRGSWVKVSKAGLFVITFGKPPVFFFGEKKPMIERETKEEVLETFELVREAVQNVDEVRALVANAKPKPKTPRKPKAA